LGPVRLSNWHGVPLHPDAVLLRDFGADSSEYSLAGDAATISDWFEREWTALGLHYVETVSRDGVAMRWFETTDGLTSDPMAGFRTSGHIFGFRRFGYAVDLVGPGRCKVILLRTN
jgi:hypothetical protein